MGSGNNFIVKNSNIVITQAAASQDNAGQGQNPQAAMLHTGMQMASSQGGAPPMQLMEKSRPGKRSG